MCFFLSTENTNSIKHLVENRSFFSSIEPAYRSGRNKKESKEPEAPKPLGVLNTDNPELLYYQTAELNLTILGGVKITGLDRLRVTLKIEKRNYSHHLPIRHGLDLYHSGQVDGLCQKMASGLEVSSALCEKTTSEPAPWSSTGTANWNCSNPKRRRRRP